jgi:hypothetical protein
MTDLGDGLRARCETAEQQLALLQARQTSTVGDLAALHREVDRLHRQVADTRRDVHRRLLAAFRTEGAHPDFVSRIMLRLVAIPMDSASPAASGSIPAPTPVSAPFSPAGGTAVSTALGGQIPQQPTPEHDAGLVAALRQMRTHRP